MSAWGDKLAGLIDRAIDALLDARDFTAAGVKRLLPASAAARYRSDPAVQDAPTLSPDRIFVAPVEVRTWDRAVARQAFLLQADRILPLPLGEVIWDVRQSRQGRWLVGAVRADLFRPEENEHAGWIAGSSPDGATIAFCLLNADQIKRRRRAWLRKVGVLGGLFLASGWFLTSWEARLDAERDAAVAAQRQIGEELGQVSEENEALRVGEADGPSLVGTTEQFLALSRLGEAGWSIASFQQNGMTAQLALQKMVRPEAGIARPTEMLAEAFGTDWQVRLNHEAREGGIVSLDYILVSEAAR